MNIDQQAATEIEEELARFERDLKVLCGKTRASIQMTLDAKMPGDLRSKRVLPRGPDPESPRTFTFEDEPAWLDWRRAEALSCLPLPVAISNEMLRTVPSRQDVEAECTTIVDLSRSTLTNCFASRGSTGGTDTPADSKIAAMLAAVASVQAVAEGASFNLRALCIREGGRVADVLRERRPRGFAGRILGKLEAHCMALFRSTSSTTGAQPEDQTTIRTGLSHVVREVHGRGVVVIVSDFLEPVESYRGLLLEALSRHKVLLLDIAALQDTAFHPPADIRANEPMLEGARHLEDGLGWRENREFHAQQWNAAVASNFRKLDAVSKGRARRERLTGRSFLDIYRSVRALLPQLQ